MCQPLIELDMGLTGKYLHLVDEQKERVTHRRDSRTSQHLR